VYNIQGIKVYSNIIANTSKNENFNIINLSILNKGFYLIKVSSGQTEFYEKIELK
jgi:hypothetical protein